MKKALLLFLPLVFSLNCFGAHPFYPDKLEQFLVSNEVDSKELRSYVRKILNKLHLKKEGQADQLVDRCPADGYCTFHKTLAYREARKFLFGDLYLREDGRGHYIKDVYCNREFDNNTEGLRYPIGEMKIPDSNFINCEHTWPQSKFTSRYSHDTQKGDLHHLFPTDSRANSVRSNHPFAEVKGGPAHNECDGSYAGKPIRINSNKRRTITAFEPPDEHKGNVARALFYFSLRYNVGISPKEEVFLRKWHVEDKVDADERRINQRIYEIQHNRNPFIDHPELVGKIRDF